MKRRLLGLDLGEKRVGVAISDELGLLAHPLDTFVFKNVEKLSAALKKIIDEKNIEGLVIGVPFTMKGTNSKKTDEVIKIIENLKEFLSLPIHTIDERLTTKMAEAALHAVGKKPGEHRNIIDQIAAVHILQNFLDSQKIKF